MQVLRAAGSSRDHVPPVTSSSTVPFTFDIALRRRVVGAGSAAEPLPRHPTVLRLCCLQLQGRPVPAGQGRTPAGLAAAECPRLIRMPCLPLSFVA